jgi:hypothetical protein
VPIYHKDARLSKDVLETLFTDDWDERVDAVSRGFLRLTVACARCHDHKFDPIPTRDLRPGGRFCLNRAGTVPAGGSRSKDRIAVHGSRPAHVLPELRFQPDEE